MTTMAKDLGANNQDRAMRKRETVTLLPDPEPAEVFFPFISVDDHVLEPGTLFEGRVPSKMKELVPQYRFGFNDEEDLPYWQIEDARVAIGTVNGAAGRPAKEWNGAASAPTQDFRQAVWDPKTRLKDMDLIGLWGSLCFPSVVWGFAGRRFAGMKDQKVGLASLKAYNDWMIEEWCAADLRRMIPCQLPWLSDPVEAGAEIRRNAANGFKSVSFSENPSAAGFASIHTQDWDPFFAACEETGTVINLHVGSSGQLTCPDPLSPDEVMGALFPLNAISASIDWVFSRVLLRFPELKIVFSEGGASWVPTVRERLVRSTRYLDVSKVWTAADPMPVEVFDRNFWFASLEDPSAFHQLDEIGRDRVMVECDYPHGDSTWPYTQELLARDLGHLTDDEIFQVCVKTASEVYGTALPPASWFANSVRGKAFASAPGVENDLKH